MSKVEVFICSAVRTPIGAFQGSLADVAVTHCHGGRGPAVSRATGALWERRGGIAVRRVAPTL